MKSIDVNGTKLTLEDDEAASAQTWLAGLQDLKGALTGFAQQLDDPRFANAFGDESLAPVLEGMVDLLQEHTSWMDPKAASTRAIVEDLLERFAAALMEATLRLRNDWEQIERLFFRSDDSQHRLTALRQIQPTGSDLHNGGRQVLILTLELTAGGELPVLASPLTAKLVYKPGDVEVDFFFVGDSSHLCGARGPYVPVDEPCTHRWCRSVSELLNTELRDQQALPTYVVWPANPGSFPRETDPNPYGYIQYLSHDLEKDRTAESEEDVRSFYQAFGRLAAVAYAFCMEDMHLQNVLVHDGRPFPIDLENAFANPFEDLARTLIFRDDIGPLLGTLDPGDVLSGRDGTAETLSYRLLLGSNGASPKLVGPRPYLAQLQAGCADTLEALGRLAGELGERLYFGRNLSPRYVLRSTSDYRAQHREVLAMLHETDDWHDLEKVRALGREWSKEDAQNWSRYWFGKILGDINGVLSNVPAPLPEYSKNVLDEALVGFSRKVGVNAWSSITADTLLSMTLLDQLESWDRLVELADLVWGVVKQRPYELDVETSWERLPVFAAVNQEMREHLRAGLPFFTRPIQSGALLDSAGREVDLNDVPESPIPRLERSDYFPGPIAQEVAERLAALTHPGIRTQVTGQIEKLLKRSRG